MTRKPSIHASCCHCRPEVLLPDTSQAVPLREQPTTKSRRRPEPMSRRRLSRSDTGTTLLRRARSADVSVFRGTCVEANKGCAILTGVGCAPTCQAPLSQVDRSARHTKRLHYEIATPRPFGSSTRACPDPPCPAPRMPPLSRNLSRSSLALSATPCIIVYFCGIRRLRKPAIPPPFHGQEACSVVGDAPLLRSPEPAFKRL